jgi:hypothetical protein
MTGVISGALGCAQFNYCARRAPVEAWRLAVLPLSLIAGDRSPFCTNPSSRHSAAASAAAIGDRPARTMIVGVLQH